MIKCYRIWESARLKEVKAELDLDFLTTCMNHQLIPRFLHIKISLPHLYKSKTYREFQQKLLEDEIHHKRKVLRSLKSRYKTLENNVKNVVSVLDMVYFKFHLYRNCESYKVRIGSIHKMKLVRLGHNLIKHPPPDKVIFNFSNRVLTSTEKDVLSLGLDFCIPPKNYRLVDHYLPFEKLAFVLSKMNFYNPSIDRKSYYHSKLKSIAASSFKNIGENLNSINNLNKSQLMALKI